VVDCAAKAVEVALRLVSICVARPRPSLGVRAMGFYWGSVTSTTHCHFPLSIPDLHPLFFTFTVVKTHNPTGRYQTPLPQPPVRHPRSSSFSPHHRAFEPLHNIPPSDHQFLKTHHPQPSPRTHPTQFKLYTPIFSQPTFQNAVL